MVLFVCTGNTCRSPMAAALFENITGKPSRSAGIFAADGASASENAVRAIGMRGLDISGHTSRQITAEMIREAELVVTMTAAHKIMLLQAFPQMSEKIVTLCEWAGEDGDVCDPFGGDLAVYEACANRIEQLIRKAAGQC